MNDALFLRWADRLMERVQRHDWPDVTGEWWAGVRELVAELRPTEAELGRLLSLLQLKPPRGLDGLVPRVVEELEALRAAAPAGDPTGRQHAAAASRDCPECSGCGMASRDHEKPGYGRYAASYYCHRCEMGRWLKAAHLADPKGPRMADLADHPELHGDPSDSIDPEMVRLFMARRRAAVAEAERKGDRRERNPVGPAF
jgi:hypothetical protein